MGEISFHLYSDTVLSYETKIKSASVYIFLFCNHSEPQISILKVIGLLTDTGFLKHRLSKSIGSWFQSYEETVEQTYKRRLLKS